MKPMKQNLYQQLFSLAIAISIIIFIFLGLVLPNGLKPIYEKNIYQYLKQPLPFITSDIDEGTGMGDIAYLYLTSDDDMVASSNFEEVTNATPNDILKNITKEYGKYQYKGKTYYYNTSYTKYVTSVSITNNSYIEQIKKDILYTIFPILALTLVIITTLIILWSRKLVMKIEHLKDKIDHIDDDNYIDHYPKLEDDELKVLSDAIDNMRLTLKQQEEYKNQMYQNISHDFKTPLTVIKSYLEALDDEMIEEADAKKVIKEQIDKLEVKVHSLLYLNKLNYIQDSNNYKKESIDILPVLNASVEKFKYMKPNLKWEIFIGDKKTIYHGTADMWEAIIDNLLNNFIRYAESIIKVTIKNGRITFYNDGPNIDEKIFDDIFTPYKKGIQGQFGLGLSIVRKTIALAGYEISVKNEKKGVSFMIK